MTIYTANIPQPGDDPSQSQDQILQNFQSLENAFDKNHVTLQDLTNRGLHSFLQMPEQLADPTTAANIGAWYTKAIGGVTRFVMRQEGNGSVIQMTGPDPVIAQNPGMTFLPGGLLLQWGGTVTVAGLFGFAFAQPFSNVYQCLCIASTNGTVATNLAYTFDNNGIIGSLSANSTLTYLAIGLA